MRLWRVISETAASTEEERMDVGNETSRAWRAVLTVLGAIAGLFLLTGVGLAGPSGQYRNPSDPCFAPSVQEISGKERLRAIDAFNLCPAVFVENKGQWDESVRYGFDGKGTRISFTDSGPVFQMTKSTGENEAVSQTVFSASFVGAKTVRPLGLDKTPGATNYFLGNDSSKWHSGVPSYQRIVYRGLYDGVDLYTWGKRSGLKYEFHVASGADWRQIVIRYEGIEGLSIDDRGALHVKTALGEMVDDAPVVYQETSDGRRSVDSRFRLIDDSSYGFDLTGDIDASLPLVIDPDLAWASYLGGMDYDDGLGIAIDGAGNVWIAGETWSSDFPASGGFQTTLAGVPPELWEYHGDAFVARLTPSGTLAWASYLGGTDEDTANAIAIDSTGNVWVAGMTMSTDFPVPGGFQTTFMGRGHDYYWDCEYGDAFAAEITPSGTLAWASYLGGSWGDTATAIAVDSTGNAWLTGDTNSGDLPTPGGFAASRWGNFFEGFIARITPSGALAWASGFGGSGAGATGIVIDSTGDAWIAGAASSYDLPAQEVGQKFGGNSGVAFLGRISRWGTFAWVTYFGGSGWDFRSRVALDSTGNIWVAGTTSSIDFPTPGGFRIVSPPNPDSSVCDVFVAKFNPQGSLAWAGCLGGDTYDYVTGIATDAAGNAWVAGYTTSDDFPTFWGFRASDSLMPDGRHRSQGFLAKVTSSGALAWATCLGGQRGDYCDAVSIDSTGDPWLTGLTYSPDFSMPGGFRTYGGCGDAFVAKIRSAPRLTITTNTLPDGAIGVAYRGSLCCSGGVEPYMGSVVAGKLPPGLSLDSTTGIVSGTPTERGTFAFTVRTTDSLHAPQTATATVSITVNAFEQLFVATTWLSVGYAGEPYNETLVAMGGLAPYRWSIPAGFLPDGLSLDPLTGVISGTPAEAGPFGFAVAVTDSNGSSATQALCMNIDLAYIEITTVGCPSAALGYPYSFNLGATGGRPPYTWWVAPECLPPGLSLDSSTGTISGIPTACGRFSFEVTVWDSQHPCHVGLIDICLEVLLTSPVIGTTSLPDGTVGTPYSQTLCIFGGFMPYTWSFQGGELPQGLSLDTSRGVISGTPMAAGPFMFIVQAIDSDAPPQDAVATICITIRGEKLLLTTASLPAGATGAAYRGTLAATGGMTPYSWSISAGTLPPGLSLDAAAGVVSGTPRALGTFDFCAQVTDSQIPADTATKALSIAVAPPGPTYHFAARDTETATTRTSYVSRISLSFTPPAADDWIIFGFCEFKCPNVNYATFVQLFIDGVGEGQNTRKPVDPTDYLPFVTVKVKNLTATQHTVQLMFKTSNSSAAAYVRRARVCAVRKAALEFYNVTQDNGVPLTSALADIVTLNWTPSATGSYLVISTAEINATTAVSTDVQTFYNGTLNDEGIIRAADNGDFTTFMSFNYLANAPAGVPITHKIAAKKVSPDAANHYMRRARILAIRLTGSRFRYAALASANEQNTTQTAFQQALSVTWTCGVNGKWLFLNSARIANSSTACQTEVRVQLNNSVTCGDQLMKPRSATDLLNYSSVDIRSLTSSRMVDMDWRTTGAAGNAKMKRLRFYGLPLDAQ